MKPIETFYRDYRFRSRLEARYAVFFDALGIRWEYEKEGYDLDGVYYLPDFWLPELQRWIEIKGQKPTPTELAKVEKLEQATGYPSCLFYGLPGENQGWAYYTCAHESNGGKSFDDDVEWQKCPMCQTVDVSIGHGDECSLYSEVEGVTLKASSCACTVETFKDYHRKRILAGTSQQLCGEDLDEAAFKLRTEQFVNELAHDLYPHGLEKRTFFSELGTAYNAAKQARFEHGAQP